MAVADAEWEEALAEKLPGGMSGLLDRMPLLEWLDDPKQRRGTLMLIANAARQGWLSGEERAEQRLTLIDRLQRMLCEQEELKPRERRRVAATLVALSRG